MLGLKLIYVSKRGPWKVHQSANRIHISQDVLFARLNKNYFSMTMPLIHGNIVIIARKLDVWFLQLGILKTCHLFSTRLEYHSIQSLYSMYWFRLYVFTVKEGGTSRLVAIRVWCMLLCFLTMASQNEMRIDLSWYHFRVYLLWCTNFKGSDLN